MIFKFKPKDRGYISKQGILQHLDPKLSEDIGKMIDNTDKGGVIQPLHTTEVNNYVVEKGYQKGFFYAIMKADTGVYKGYATRKVEHFLTNKTKIVNIETTIRKTEHECGKELFSKIEAAMLGYKFKYRMN